MDTKKGSAVGVVDSVRSALRRQEDAYRNGEEISLGGFLGVMAVYCGAVGIGSVALRRRGLPERIEFADIALAAVATHKFSRLLTKESVTAPLRAPFTRFEEASGSAELKEEPRGSGARRTVGELATCPFCAGHWVATGFSFGLVLAPRATRLVAAVLATVAGADFLQLAYAIAEQRAES